MISKKPPVIPILLFSLSGLLVCYAIWAFVECHGYIRDAVKAGQLIISGNEYDVVSFYMNNCSHYFLFAVIFAVLAWMLIRPLTYPSQKRSDQKRLPLQTPDDEELDEWFDEIRNRDNKTE